MMQIAPRIVVDERVQAGKPVIAGTRVPVETLLGVLAVGETMERVMSEYCIQKEDVLAAIAYAASAVSGEDIREVSRCRTSSSTRISRLACRSTIKSESSSPPLRPSTLPTSRAISWSWSPAGSG